MLKDRILIKSVKRRPQRYDAILPTISTKGHRLNLWVVLTGLWLLISPLTAVAVDLPAQALVDTIAGQAAPSAGESVESAESWLSVDETMRRTTFLPNELRWRTPEASATEALPGMTGIEADADRYRKGLKEQRPFGGVYFLSGAARDVDSGDTDINFRLEWDLFKRGRYERKKELEKRRNQNELQTLQILNDVNQHRLNEQLDGIEFLAQAVQYHQAEELAALLADILRRRRVQLEKGYITRDDFDHIRFKYRQAELKKKLYGTGRRAALEASLHDLLNCVEFADLIALDRAQQAAVEQACSLKIQQNLVERAQYARSWADDLSLNLYIERRRDFDDTSRSNVGFEVKIPIQWDTKRGLLIDQEKRLYEKQAAVLTRRIKSNLVKLYDFFAFQQVRIQMLLLDLEKSAQQKAYEQIRAERALEDLNNTPERSLDRIRMEEIDLRYEAIQTRLKLYEILIKIAALTHADHPRDLIAGIQTHCPVR
jgi:hypothetical protein